MTVIGAMWLIMYIELIDGSCTLLHLGVNMPDHTTIFMNLISQLKDGITPYIAQLSSKDCHTIKALLTKLVSQLMQTDNMSDDSEEIEMRKVPCTMSVLCSWYHHSTMSSPVKKQPKSPRKRSSRGHNVCFPQFPPVVVIIEDLEGFTSTVLQDFITMCSENIKHLPVVLLFGIATSVTVVHRLLPQHISSLLSIDKFQSKPSTEYLSEVIQKTLLSSDHPFRLGHKVFQLLLDLFLFHDFSTTSFIKGLQFAMMEHFFSQPASVLCCKQQDLASRIQKLNKNDVDMILQLPSVKRYIPQLEKEKQVLIKKSLTDAKVVISEIANKMFTYDMTFVPVMQCLHIMTGNLPRYPLGKQLRELYAMCLENSIVNTEEYQHASNLTRMFARDELFSLLGQCEVKLRSCQKLQAEADKLKDFQTRLEQLGDRCSEFVEEDEKSTEPEPEVKKEAGKKEKTTLKSLQKQLMESAKKSRKLTKYEELRDDCMAFLKQMFMDYLKCPQSMPLFEVFYCTSVSEVRHHINASPRASLQTALSNPHYYLQCKCCKTEPGRMVESFPDLCIIYKLHLECSRFINLYDWLQAFITVVEGNCENDDEKENKDDVLHARFIRAVSELQFLGFIKHTRRKTDHVARLTWGGC
ncbi:origin recognition complex subunit 3-like [Anneissia japonica]|uniref:origin recognition complex subunit 3-like n=1 Tax=Anneissia japonica TaxID=1529436 RepID=UPI0014256316|nr:origin recognition complex subunit 3-like [Anneissia japonica]